LSTLLQRLGSLQRLYSPPQVTIGGTQCYIGVVGGFEVRGLCKLVGFPNPLRKNKELGEGLVKSVTSIGKK
jgi:hypothetical protein